MSLSRRSFLGALLAAPGLAVLPKVGGNCWNNPPIFESGPHPAWRYALSHMAWSEEEILLNV